MHDLTPFIQQLISHVSFGPNLDLSWQWELEEVHTISSHRPKRFEEGPGPSSRLKGWHIRASFARSDRETGKRERGYGRWWFMSFESAKSGCISSMVAKTMFAAAKLVLEHELLESFLFDGKRPFDPHRSILELTRKSPFREVKPVKFVPRKGKF